LGRRPLGAVLHSSNEPGELSQWLCHDDSTINIVLDVILYYIILLYSNGSVHWPLMGGLLHLVPRGGARAGCGPAQSPPRCTKCSNPPINGQCTNHRNCCIMIGCSVVSMWRLKGFVFTRSYVSFYARAP